MPVDVFMTRRHKILICKFALILKLLRMAVMLLLCDLDMSIIVACVSKILSPYSI